MPSLKPIRTFAAIILFFGITVPAFCIDPISLSLDQVKARVNEIFTDELSAGRIVIKIDPQQPALASIFESLPSSAHFEFLNEIRNQVASKMSDVIAHRFLNQQGGVFIPGATYVVMNSLPFFSSIQTYFEKHHGEKFDGNVLIVKVPDVTQWRRFMISGQSDLEDAGIAQLSGMAASRQPETADMTELTMRVLGTNSSNVRVKMNVLGFNQLMRATQKYFYGSPDILHVGPGIDFSTPIAQASLLHESRHLIDFERRDCTPLHCDEFNELESVEITAGRARFMQETMNSRAFREYRKNVTESWAKRFNKSINESQRWLESKGVFQRLAEAQWNYMADRLKLVERRAEFDEIQFLKTVHGFTAEQILEVKAHGTGMHLEVTPTIVFEIPAFNAPQLQKHELDLYNRVNLPDFGTLKSPVIHSLCARVISLMSGTN
jgi:hypothetical protein